MVMKFILAFLIHVCFKSVEVVASEACTDRQVAIIPSSGPVVCMPFNKYQELALGATKESETNVTPSLWTEIAYQYMSPMWLDEQAEFFETPSAVVAGGIAFGPGVTSKSNLFKVSLAEAGSLKDDVTYSVKLNFFRTRPTAPSDPSILICDDVKCVGFTYYTGGEVWAHGGSAAGTTCLFEEHVQMHSGSLISNWDIRVELHPNRTVAFTSAQSSLAVAHLFGDVLKPSRGLALQTCRDDTHESYNFLLFEYSLKVNR